ncbi:MAG: TonB-dependent receptor plug domain-containing protein, partial [Bacteroidota bacterium]
MKKYLPRLVCLLLPLVLITPVRASVSPVNAVADAIAYVADSQDPGDSDTVPLTEVLTDLGTQYNTVFSYRLDLVEDIEVKYESTAEENLDSRLQRLLKGTGLAYRRFAGNRIVIYQKARDRRTGERQEALPSNRTSPSPQQISGPLFGQREQRAPVAPAKVTFEVRGYIVDEEQTPLIGASVTLESDPATGTVTDVDGYYSLEIPDGDATLVFAYLGYQTQKAAVNNRTKIDVVLASDVQALEEVIVVGYGTQRRADVIGAVSSLKGEDLPVQSTANFDAALQGMATGVSVLSQSGKPGAPSTIKIRGANSIQSSTEPLWVIDGMPVYSSPTGLGSTNLNPMSLINPSDIESIQILKDAAATSIYGSRGSNGVIIVTTKTGRGSEGQTSVNISSGISDLTRTPEDVGYVNTTEWFRVMDQAYQNTFGRNFKLSDYYQFAPLAFDEITRTEIETQRIDTDWYDEVFRTGSFQNIN